MANITPDVLDKLNKAKEEADKHFSNHPEINIEQLTKESTESIRYCSTVIAKNPQYNAELFSLFQKQIKVQIQNTGCRYIYCMFASAKRLQEWAIKGDCSVPISIQLVTEEQANKQFSTIYPKTLEACRNNKERVLVALGSSMYNFLNIYSVVALDLEKFTDETTSRSKQRFPFHSKLEAVISIIPDNK